MSSASADATLELQNPVTLVPYWWYPPTFMVENGSAPVDAKLSGGLSGNSDFMKSGDGTLELSAANSYNGTTRITGGVLRLTHPLAIPGGIGANERHSNLNIYGSVLELGADNFYRPLGNGLNQVIFNNSSGGFSASGANRIVNLARRLRHNQLGQ